jgi:predicted  nucleic acid-binding Zn-ribbon protein
VRVVLDSGETLDLGETEATPTIGIVDYSRRVTDDYGVTTVVERGFARRMSVRLVVPFDQADALQASLAAIRAKPARWIADEGVDWLDFRGFFKDFEIDLPVPPKAYCTLTVEALTDTEAFADAGGDPAPLGQASTLQVLQPATIAGGALVASTVPENDYPEWSAGTTYPLGARVIKAATHRIYESGSIGNVGNDPVGVSGKWRDIGPTNRWAMFDQALGSTTEAAGQITVTLAEGTINAAALLDVKAATVRVVANGYDRTLAPNASGTVTFLDMPETAGQVTVVITGPVTVEVGTLLVGKLVGLGSTTDDAKAGITDFSRKEADEFGDIQVVERAWAKRMTLPAKLRRDAIDLVAGRIAAVRAKPSLWIGKEGMETLTVYGFFKDFSIAVDTTICSLSLSIEGLSTAGKVEPLTASVDWPDVGDPAGTKPEDNATVGAPAGTDVAGKPAEEVVGQLEQQDEALAQLDTDIGQATINIAAAQNTIAQMQVDAAATKAELEEDISSLNATAAQIQADAAGTRASLETAQADILAAGGRIDTIEIALGDQEASINSIAQTVSNHTGRLASIDTTLTANGASINQNAQTISAVQGDLASLSSTVSTQGASISQNAQAISTANQNIASLTTRVGTAESSISQNATAISGVSGRTATLESTVSAHGTSITQNAQAISTTQGNLASLSSTVTSQGSSISQLQSASSTQAGDIATLKTRVVAGSPNLYSNGGLEQGLVNFGAPVGVTLSIEFSGWAGRHLKLTTSLADFYVNTPAIPCDAGVTYTASADTNFTASTGSMRTHLIFVNSSNLEIARFTAPARGGHNFDTTENGRAANACTGLAPAGTTGMLLQVQWLGVTGIGYAGVRLIKFESGATWSTYSPEASIVQTYTALSTAQTQIASLQTTVSTQGATIASNATAISTLQTQTATLTTQVTSGNPNLLANGGFENGLKSWAQAPSNWGWSGPASTWGTYVYFGVNGSSGADRYFYLDSDYIGVEQTTYTVSGDLWAQGPSSLRSYFDIHWFNSSGTNIGVSGGYGQRLGGVPFGNRYYGTVTAPAGATSARVRPVFYVPAGVSADGMIARQIKFERGSVMTAYSNEASVAQTFQALTTLTTQYASLSTTVSTQGVTISSQQTAITTINNNVTTLYGRAALTIEAGGVITGWEVNNNGTTGDIKLRADRVSVVTAAGGTKTFEIRQGTIIGYYSNSQKMYQLGEQSVA